VGSGHPPGAAGLARGSVFSYLWETRSFLSTLCHFF